MKIKKKMFNIIKINKQKIIKLHENIYTPKFLFLFMKYIIF